MSGTDELRHFLRAHRAELVLSVYLEARSPDPAERRNRHVRLRQAIARVRTDVEAASREENDLFELLVRDALDRMPHDGTTESGESWACFCAAGGDVLEFALPPGAETSIHWGLGANVVPYLRVAVPDAALIAQLDRAHARLTRWQEGRFETLLELEADAVRDAGVHMGDTPRIGFHGGTRGRTRTDEVQRQRREGSEHLQAALLHKLVNESGHALAVVLGGSADAAAHFLRLLPPSIARRSVVSDGLKMSPPADTLPVIRSALEALHRARLEERLGELRGVARGNGLATLRLQTAERAAAHGAISELIFSDSAWHDHPHEVERLIQQALADGAEVAWAGPPVSEGLDGEAEGLVAGLRFAVADGG